MDLTDSPPPNQQALDANAEAYDARCKRIQAIIPIISKEDQSRIYDILRTSFGIDSDRGNMIRTNVARMAQQPADELFPFCDYKNGLSLSDLCTVGDWLNGSVIDAFMKYVCWNSKTCLPIGSYLGRMLMELNPSAEELKALSGANKILDHFSKLSAEGAHGATTILSILRAMKREIDADVHNQLQFVYAPVNIYASHWILLRAELKSNRNCHFTCFDPAGNTQAKVQVYSRAAELLGMCLVSMGAADSCTFSFSPHFDMTLPKQADGVSCGPFVLAFVWYFVNHGRAPCTKDFGNQIVDRIALRIAILHVLMSE